MTRKYNNTLSKFSSVGTWEYNLIKDSISMDNAAANIYFGKAIEKVIKTEELFARLTPFSAQQFVDVLSKKSDEETVFYQQVYQDDMYIKKVLVIIKYIDNTAVGISVDFSLTTG